jgi:superfamily II helicase
MSNPITSKVCRKCLIEKSLEHFNKQSSVKDGYKNFCKECFKLINKELYIKNKKHIIRNVLKRRAESKEVKKPDIAVLNVSENITLDVLSNL